MDSKDKARWRKRNCHDQADSGSRSSCQKQLSNFRVSQSGIFGILIYQSMSALLHWGITILGTLGLNALNNPGKFQMSCVFPPPALIPIVLSKFLLEHVTSHFRFLILLALCWLEVPWLPKVPKNVWKTLLISVGL